MSCQVRARECDKRDMAARQAVTLGEAPAFRLDPVDALVHVCLHATLSGGHRLVWVRDILENGPAWFAGHGRHGRKGLRSFSVSGRVRKPGVHLAPAGITATDLIEEYCGGMLDGHVF